MRGPYILAGAVISATGSIILGYVSPALHRVRADSDGYYDTVDKLHWTSLLWCFPCNHWMPEQHPSSHGLVAEQRLHLPSGRIVSPVKAVLRLVYTDGHTYYYSAITVGGGGIGGIIASVSFRSKDARNGYRPGLWTTGECRIPQ